MQLAAGQVFAGYTILRQIGTGGMGAVYLVDHPRLPRQDALKLLNRDLSSEPDFVARFLREADVVAGLSHRNIVPIYDRGEENGQLWLSMRYVDGIDGEAALAEAGGLLPPARAVHIVSEVAAALEAAHRRNLVHRDVKPANILLCRSDDDEGEQVFLTDFGIAKSLDASSELTSSGRVVGTFDYASPEQIEARPLDSRSDVYSLGCVLYKLLTGSVPFPGGVMLAAAAGHMSLPPPKPTVLAPWLAPRLDDVVARAMAKNPADRYPTCRALAAAASAAMNDYPNAPRPPYRVFLSRTVNAAGSGQHFGPMRTDSLPPQQLERLVDLVRRTRFFDLPENLGGSGGQRPVTIEIGCTGRDHRVVADLDSAQRPPEFDQLAAEIERMATTRETGPMQLPAVPAPPPPRRNPQLPTSLRAENPVRHGAASTTSVSRIAEPPPPPSAFPQAEPVRGRGGPQQPQGPSVQPGHGGPVLPPPPWEQPGGFEPATRRPRRRRALIAALVAVLVAAGVTTFFLTRISPPGDDREAPTIPPYTASAAAKAALDELPASTTPLPETRMVAPRRVGGNVDLYLVDTSTKKVVQQLTSGPEEDEGPILSPDRRTIIYARQVQGGPYELRTIAVGGTGDDVLFSQGIPGCKKPGRPAWDPQEATLLAIACADDDAAADLRLISMDGRTVRQLQPPNRPKIEDISFSPDGTQIAYWADQSKSGQGAIFVQYIAEESKPVQVTSTGKDKDVAWSPNGKLLAFSRGVPGQREIWVQPPDPSAEDRQLTHDGGVAEGPAWSPDGSMIVYSSDRQPAGSTATGGHWWVMTAEGDNPNAIDTEGRSYDTPAWGPAPVG